MEVKLIFLCWDLVGMMDRWVAFGGNGVGEEDSGWNGVVD
jgi:hypothetical protein